MYSLCKEEKVKKNCVTNFNLGKSPILTAIVRIQEVSYLIKRNRIWKPEFNLSENILKLFYHKKTNV